MADTNAKLEALGSAIRNQIDEIGDDSSGGVSPVTAEGAEQPTETPAPPPAPTPAPVPEPAPEPKPAVAAPPAAAPTTPSPAPVSAAPEPGAIPAAAPAPDLLSGYDPQYINMLRKFATGGKITTPDELRDAQARAANDYWRNNERLAEQARKAAEVPPSTPTEVPPPPELARFDTKIQAIRERATGVVANIDGWARERARVFSEVRQLQARRDRGDTTVDPDEISSKWAEVHKIDEHIQGWNGKYLELRDTNDELLARRDEVKLNLDIRSRLERQEQEREEQSKDAATQEFFNEWSTTLKTLATEMKVPPSRLAKLEERARHATYFAATDQPIEDIRSFLTGVVQDFMQPIEAARQEGAINYTQNKATDAPRVPAPGKPVVEAPPASAPPSLRDLEKLVMGDKSWDEAPGA